MTYEVVATWNPLPSDEEKETLIDLATQWMALGKTNSPTAVLDYPNGYPEVPLIAIRTFTTQADAEEWVAFLQTQPTIPESVEIVN